MDESSGSDDKNKKSDTPTDWELLSMSMTGSDFKPALDSPKSGDNGVSDATMHSQYFAHPPKHVTESAPEEIPQESASEAIADTSEPVKVEIEQQILVSTLSPRSASNMEFGDGGESEGFYTAEVRKIEGGGAVVEEVTEAVVIPAAKEKTSCSMKKRLQAVASKVNRTTALWSLAVVATVAGLIIIGSRWYYERLQYLEMMDLGGPAYDDEKISEMAQEIVEANEALSLSVPEPTGESVERQSGPSSFFASLRELW